MKKVIVLHYIPTPHRNYQFNLMNKFYLESGISFKVFFLSKSDKNRDWKSFDIQFDYEIMENLAIRVGSKDLYTFFINTGIWGILKREKPDKIICFGWDNLSAYISMYWARKNGKEFILWSGSTDNEKSWRRTLFNPLVTYIVKHSDKCIGDGTRHRDYLIKLGADPKNVEKFYYQVDVDYFENKSNEFSPEEKYNLKTEIGISTTKIIFFSGQLIERKGIFELLEAFKNYRQKDQDVSLLFLGRGREKENMLKIIQDENIENVFFVNFVQYDEVYKYFAISNLFILPSREEAWGLVINEAMACGLPVITTDKVGACDDLIDEGLNGYVIQSNCPLCIENAIRKIYENKLDVNNNSKKKIKGISMIEMIKQSNALNFTT